MAQAEGFKRGGILSSIARELFCRHTISLDTALKKDQRQHEKKIMCNVMTDIKCHANVQFLSQINLMHKPFGHINIRKGFLGHKSKSVLQSAALTWKQFGKMIVLLSGKNSPIS